MSVPLSSISRIASCVSDLVSLITTTIHQYYYASLSPNPPILRFVQYPATTLSIEHLYYWHGILSSHRCMAYWRMTLTLSAGLCSIPFQPLSLSVLFFLLSLFLTLEFRSRGNFYFAAILSLSDPAHVSKLQRIPLTFLCMEY
ncbi:hypothetical protein BO85DRAFT_203119 [Aspergillus piperis CBS 112811]|uniref:Uncharacterized protein n=1 Tax=Aspergillus piperis CBS 112811 TaxID=1448313 RepID=A0A8G1QRN2_9EURO|nr:hypothetical protein BO85DRAFT_203119 [Aspergillus piperis CBS 112811]RAH52359.1 hypothetical protein BO85DRAFT_203119 [Aspergillus piperis CBS 112811]